MSGHEPTSTTQPRPLCCPGAQHDIYSPRAGVGARGGSAGPCAPGEFQQDTRGCRQVRWKARGPPCPSPLDLESLPVRPHASFSHCWSPAPTCLDTYTCVGGSPTPSPPLHLSVRTTADRWQRDLETSSWSPVATSPLPSPQTPRCSLFPPRSSPQ